MSEREKSAIDRAKEYGIDITLLESNLRRTPTERLEGLISMMDVYEEGQRIQAEKYGDLIVRDKIQGFARVPPKEQG